MDCHRTKDIERITFRKGQKTKVTPQTLMHENDFLHREIASRVRRYFPDLSPDASLAVLHKGRPLVRKHSILFEISVFDHSRRSTHGMFVKIPKRASAKTVQGIYETLVHLYAFSTQLPGELNVVRPLDCLPELRAIVTERIEGQSLDYLLRRRQDTETTSEILRNCGRFLHAYHEGMGQITWQTDFVGEFRDRCSAYLKDLEDDGIGKEERGEILAGFEQGAVRLRHGVPVCLTAKDYHVRNIIVQEKSIFFIDVTEPRGKTIYDDIATFLNSLTMLFWGKPGFFLGATASPMLGERFLKGYFNDAFPRELISLFCARSLCHRWHKALESLSARKPGITGAIGYIPLRHCINRFFHAQIMAHLHTALEHPASRVYSSRNP